MLWVCLSTWAWPYRWFWRSLFAEGLRGLRSSIASGKRYGTHCTWLFIKLANPVFYWWSLWGFRDSPEFWNFWTYVLTLSAPAIMYLQMTSLVSDRPNEISDWRMHFYNQRQWFFILNAILGAIAIALSLGGYSDTPRRIISAAGYSFFLILSLMGIFSDNPRLHAFIAFSVAAFTILFYGIATYSPV